MDFTGDQIQPAVVAVAVVTIIAALLCAFFYLARRTWAWIVGAPKKAEKAVPPAQEPIVPLSNSPVVTSADFLVVKSNMLTVFRQIEDLERRMKYGHSQQATVIKMKRA